MRTVFKALAQVVLACLPSYWLESHHLYIASGPLMPDGARLYKKRVCHLAVLGGHGKIGWLRYNEL